MNRAADLFWAVLRIGFAAALLVGGLWLALQNREAQPCAAMDMSCRYP